MKKTMIGLLAIIFFSGVLVSLPAVYAEPLDVDIHGFVSQGYLKSPDYDYLANDAKKGSYQYSEMGLNFSDQVTPNLRIGAQFFARDIGDSANNKITLDWAYGDYRFQDWLGIRLGKIKLPLGLYNETRDMDMLRACIVLPQSIYYDLLRDTLIATNGGALYGSVFIPKAGSLEYQVQAGIINVDPDSGVAKDVANSEQLKGATLGEFGMRNYTGSLRWNTPLTGFAVKASVMKSDGDLPLSIPVPAAFNPDNTINPMNVTVGWENLQQIYSLEYIYKNLTLSAEYRTLTTDTTAMGNETSVRTESYYGMGSYRFNTWFEAGAYYSELYPNAKDKDGKRYTDVGSPDYYAWQKDLALFARFDINDYFLFKLEGHYVNGVSSVMIVDNPSRDDENWMYFAAKATLNF